MAVPAAQGRCLAGQMQSGWEELEDGLCLDRMRKIDNVRI